MNRSDLIDSPFELDRRPECVRLWRMSSASSYVQLLVLERRDPRANMARFYVLSLEPTLFGYEIGVKAADRYERRRASNGGRSPVPCPISPPARARSSPRWPRSPAVECRDGAPARCQRLRPQCRRSGKQNAAVLQRLPGGGETGGWGNEAANQIESGIYPPALEDAAKAVERLRVALTRAHCSPALKAAGPSEEAN